MNKDLSIITPYSLFNELKSDQLDRCIDSVLGSRNYSLKYSSSTIEHILIRDGNNKYIRDNADEYTVRHLAKSEDRRERLWALNSGLKEAKGEWIAFLDSDDEYLSQTISIIFDAIFKYPEHRLFNFQSIHVNKNCKVHVRPEFKPRELEVGHEVFGGGNIVNGTYVFHRDCMGDDIDKFLPIFNNPWDFSIYAQQEFPEIKELFTVTNEEHPKGYPKELGNPWGQDFYMFYKLTRKYKSKAIDVPIIMIHHEGKEEDGRHSII